MASKVIYMDSVATAHLRDDGSIRIEVGAGMHSGSIQSTFSRIPAAIDRATTHKTPQAYDGGPMAESLGRLPDPAADRAS